jgi:hypothetical protein
MVNDLVVGISRKLYALFGDEYRIYAEHIPQDLQPPAFYVRLLQSGVTPIVGRRYFRNHSFDVHFFPVENETELQQCYAAEAILLEGLEYVTIDDLTYRGTSRRTEIVDNVLHMFVQYNLLALKAATPEDYMEDLTQLAGVKE